MKFLTRDADAHAEEHSIEIQLPFLHRVLGKFEFVPISLSYLSIDECAELGDAIAAACKAQAGANIKTIILASSDLSHYLSPVKTDELDRLALDQVLEMDPEGLVRVVEDNDITMCGVLPAAVMLFAARDARRQPGAVVKTLPLGRSNADAQSSRLCQRGDKCLTVSSTAPLKVSRVTNSVFRGAKARDNLTCQNRSVKGALDARGVCRRQTESLTNRR